MNARNLLYIAKYNSQANKKFADDKIFTKNFLQSRGIEVAKLYQIVRNHQELTNFNFFKLPNSFVIKPNKGFGGEGILVIKNRKNNNFIQTDEEPIDRHNLYRHCDDIIDGKYAISGLSDSIIFEEKLEAHKYFAGIGIIGLPDIRIIVFNYVPVIAMLRLPTQQSKGKANLHLGGIGVGIDIGTGKGTYGVRNNKFTSKLPNGYKVNSIEIPNWDKILLTAAQTQQISGIGYLAVDICLTTTGIKVLELNARAGLAVQIANKTPLKSRLQKVDGLRVINAQQGVEVAKTLFTEKISSENKTGINKTIIDAFEQVLILGEKNFEVLAKIDPHCKDNIIESSLLEDEESLVDLIIKGKRIKLPFKKGNLKDQNYKLSISGQYLSDFLLNPRFLNNQKISNFKHLDEKIISNIDNKVCEIDSKVKLLSYLKPLNLSEEREKFLANPISSPRFTYKNAENLAQLRKELNKIPREVEHPLLPIYLNKIEEIENKINLIESINSLEFGSYSEKLYGKADRYLHSAALAYIEKCEIKEDKSNIIDIKEITQKLNKFLKDKKLSQWNIKLIDDSPADIQVNKNHTIFLSKKAQFTTNRLKAVIAHEIETHIYRLENGRHQKYQIFQRGTANYLATEEGLAIHNQIELGLSLGIKHIQFAISAIAIYFGKKMTFCELFHYLKDTYHLDDNLAWRICVKVKRGLIDTTMKTSFTKDLVYFQGYQQVKDYLDKTPHGIEKLYIGKINIEDLKTLDASDIKLVKAKLLPSLI